MKVLFRKTFHKTIWSFIFWVILLSFGGSLALVLRSYFAAGFVELLQRRKYLLLGGFVEERGRIYICVFLSPSLLLPKNQVAPMNVACE